MDKFQKLIEVLKEHQKRLSLVREISMTSTEKFLLEGRLVDVQRLLVEAFKIRDEEDNGKISGKPVRKDE